MINIVLCDDDKEYSERVSESLKKAITEGKYKNEAISITEFHDSVETMEYCLKNEVHILFLDIDMPVMTGFDIANVIRENNEEIKIIFVSAFENLVYTSFKYSPFRFIRKGNLEKEVPEAFLAAMKAIFYKDMYLTVINKSESEKVFYSHICTLESRANYVEVVTVRGARIKYRTTMNSLEKELSEYGFMRVHAGYMVAISKIKYFRNDLIEMSNGQELKVSRKYHAKARETFRKYLRNEI